MKLKKMLMLSAFAAAVGHAPLSGEAFAQSAEDAMMAQCRSRAARALKARMPDISTKYEGQRTDGTHAVNGTATVGGGERTFQCSFNRAGRRIVRFVASRAPAGGATAGPATANVEDRMKAQCRARAARSLRARLPDVDVKYEGQRTDGTHAVNGTATIAAGTRTFQCSFNRAGRRIVRFVVN